MPLYHWKSQTLRDWAEGDIVVSARSVKEARKLAIELSPYSNTTGIASDVSVEPDVSKAVFIHGSA